jgi:hypothetical protein
MVNNLNTHFKQKLFGNFTGLIKTMIYHGDELPADWSSVPDTLTAKDTFYRVFGTTIGLGLDSVHEALQMSISKTLSGNKPGMLIDIIQPSAIFDEELIFPTISGLPLNFDLQAVRLDSVKLEIIGASDLSSLFKPTNEDSSSNGFEYKFTVNADAAVTLKGSAGLGAHTPIHTGYQAEGKLDHKQHFGVAISTKNGPNLDLDLKINFPNQVISSKDLSLDIFTFEEIQGKYKKLRNGNSNEVMLGESLRLVFFLYLNWKNINVFELF